MCPLWLEAETLQGRPPRLEAETLRGHPRQIRSRDLRVSLLVASMPISAMIGTPTKPDFSGKDNANAVMRVGKGRFLWTFAASQSTLFHLARPREK